MNQFQKLKANDILVIASQNLGKLKEISQVLSPFKINCQYLANWTNKQIDETGSTFRENAEIKALHAVSASQLPALADDSGLCIDLLDGKPGIHSSRWAENDYSKAFNIIKRKLEQAGWNGISLIRARFICSICLAMTNNSVHHFEGVIEGQLKFPPKGLNGFGYDSIFIANNDTLTFAEQSKEDKILKSHRGKALSLLLNSNLFI